MDSINFSNILSENYGIEERDAKDIVDRLLQYVSQHNMPQSATNLIFLQKFLVILSYAKGNQKNSTIFKSKPISQFLVPMINYDEFFCNLILPEDVWRVLFDIIETDIITEPSCKNLLEQLKNYCEKFVPNCFAKHLDNYVLSWITYSILCCVDWFKKDIIVFKEDGIDWDFIFRHKYCRDVIKSKLDGFVSCANHPKKKEEFAEKFLQSDVEDKQKKGKQTEAPRIIFDSRLIAFLSNDQLLEKDEIEFEIDLGQEIDYRTKKSHVECDECAKRVAQMKNPDPDESYHTGEVNSIQIRGADEPPTIFYYCYYCKQNYRKKD